jgi:hypothetical protein
MCAADGNTRRMRQVGVARDVELRVDGLDHCAGKADYWLLTFAFGVIVPTLVGWFVVPPIKGTPIMGGPPWVTQMVRRHRNRMGTHIPSGESRLASLRRLT